MGFGGGGGLKGAGGSGGASAFDMAAINDAVQGGMTALHNRYAQLGLGVPSGDPAQAAKSGTSLAYAGPGTAERTDMANLQQLASAAIGQVQGQNIGNPAAPGSPANINFNQNQLFG